jgi:hypothetical protein
LRVEREKPREEHDTPSTGRGLLRRGAGPALALLFCALALIAAGVTPVLGAGTTTTTQPNAPTQARRLSPTTGTFSTCHMRLDNPENYAGTLKDFGHEIHLTTYKATCESCHALPVHTSNKVNVPTMQSCYVCHGQVPGSRTQAYCALCHPPGFKLTPASHTSEFFLKGHSLVVAAEGTDNCFMCHAGNETTFCRACHGVDIPHPPNWTLTATGGPGLHVAASYSDGPACVKCHGNRVTSTGHCYGGECHGS